MLKWLRRKLRDWLLADDAVSDELEIRGSDGVWVQATAVRAVGTALLCRHASGERLVGPYDVRDTAAYNRVWQRLSRGRATWESDGTRADL